MEMLLRPQGKWEKVVAEATRPLQALKEPGNSIGYSIDIKMKEGMTLLAKAGSQSGFSSLIIWNKETGVGFVALANRGKDPTSLAKMLIQAHSQARQIYQSPLGSTFTFGFHHTSLEALLKAKCAGTLFRSTRSPGA